MLLSLLSEVTELSRRVSETCGGLHHLSGAAASLVLHLQRLRRPPPSPIAHEPKMPGGLVDMTPDETGVSQLWPDLTESDALRLLVGEQELVSEAGAKLTDSSDDALLTSAAALGRVRYYVGAGPSIVTLIDMTSVAGDRVALNGVAGWSPRVIVIVRDAFGRTVHSVRRTTRPPVARAGAGGGNSRNSRSMSVAVGREALAALEAVEADQAQDQQQQQQQQQHHHQHQHNQPQSSGKYPDQAQHPGGGGASGIATSPEGERRRRPRKVPLNPHLARRSEAMLSDMFRASMSSADDAVNPPETATPLDIGAGTGADAGAHGGGGGGGGGGGNKRKKNKRVNNVLTDLVEMDIA
jgi:hypothetical protein